jgi:hypothetical protein
VLRPLLAAACALLLPAAAGAQDPPRPPIAESAADLAYGYCPLYLAEQFSLTGPELARHGFAQKVETQQDPRFGEMRLVSAKRDDGELIFGGAAGKTCTVIISGPQREAALSKLRETMGFTGLSFQPVPHTGAQIEGIKVETFKAPVERQFLYVQLIEAGGATPMVSAQLFGMEE